MFMPYELQVAAFMLFVFVHSHTTSMEDDVAAVDLHLAGWHDSLKAENVSTV